MGAEMLTVGRPLGLRNPPGAEGVAVVSMKRRA